MTSTRRPSIFAPRHGSVVVGLLVLMGFAACSGDDSASSQGQHEAAPVEAVAVDELDWAECENDDEGFVVSHPVGWDTGNGSELTCGAFHPGGHPDGPAVELQVIDEPLTTLVAQVEDEGGRVDESILDRRRAAEVDPDGAEGTRWLIDLRNARTLELTGRTSPSVAAAALDAVVQQMTDSLRWVDPRSSGEGLEPVGAPVDEVVEGRPDEPDDRTTLLTDLRAAAQDGFDRVVIELDGASEPQFRVAPLGSVPVLDEAGIPIEGDRYLEITVSPASLFDGNGDRSYEGPLRTPVAGDGVVEEAVLVPSADADELRVVVGLQREAGFAVAVIPDPVRLVIDVIHDPVVGEEP